MDSGVEYNMLFALFHSLSPCI